MVYTQQLCRVSCNKHGILTVSQAVCRLLLASGILPDIASTLATTTHAPLIPAMLNALLHVSQHAPSAKLLAEDTDLLGVLPGLLRACGVTLKAPLLPVAIDLLWNLLDALPQPRTLPDRVRCTDAIMVVCAAIVRHFVMGCWSQTGHCGANRIATQCRIDVQLDIPLLMSPNKARRQAYVSLVVHWLCT